LYQLNQTSEYVKTAMLQRKTVPSKEMHPTHLIRRIQKGLPFSELEALQRDLDLPLDQLAGKLSISRATLHRRKTARRLSPEESDKVMRFSRLLEHAATVFGTVERARAWLKFPQFGLGGAVPLDYAKTEIGAREVDNLLGRIDYGVYS
jgi:putative toxin-antitoxin system antitoxin component (TIGR02293 family)